MWYFIEENEEGDFADENGKRYLLIECHKISSPDGKENAELGFTEFQNLAECLAAWGLSEIK